ncbi:MAG: invasion associated locus B family protein [Pseudomonadota bacterium]
MAAPLAAKDSLGVYWGWAAFRDAGVPRCYAIAAPEPRRNYRANGAYASVGTWPAQQVRGQLHIRLSRASAKTARVRLTIGNQRFDLMAQGSDAWAKDKAMDAAVIAAMRAATRMSVRGVSSRGAAFTDRYDLGGAATAMDAALVGCSNQG